MQNKQFAVKRESSNKKLDEKDLEYLIDLISKRYESGLNTDVSKKPNYDLLAKNLINSYFLETKKQESLSQRIWKNFSTFTIIPDTTVNDYLANTTLNISANKSIASDWKKVGDQLWLSYLKQPEVKVK
ncbi:hypothetical protein [Pseudoalteromonas rhizosphaerae]|uniref:hypothetical protein n=1 Tax=Pseudoalteromonas rhizosphaerae TaxID=2518973 RepID=UPI00384BE0BE